MIRRWRIPPRGRNRLCLAVAVLLAVAAGALTGAAGAAAQPTGPAPRSVLVILVDWAAGNGTPAAPPDGTTTAQAAGQVGGTDVGWFQAVSYGQFGGWNTAAVGPYTIATPPLDGGTSCVNAFRATIQAEGNRAAAAAGFDVAAYAVVMYYFSAVPCGWGAWTVGNAVWINGQMTTPATVHELGHTLYLGHGHAQTCRNAAGQPVALSTTCQTIEYGDPYDVMGCCGPGSFSAIQKYDLGWMAGRVQTVPAGGGTYTLQPLETPSVGTQALRLVDGAETLWVEYRQPVGVDNWLSPASTDGVLVYRQLPDGANPLGSNLLDMTPGSAAGFSDAPLRPGTAWSNPLGHLTLSVVSAGPSGAVVEVRPGVTTVPDVVGAATIEAREAITAAGLTVVQQSVVDPTCEFVGLVMSQSPVGGTTVAAGSAVTIRIGRRPIKLCD